MMNDFYPVRIHLIIENRSDLSGNVFSLQNRYLCQILLGRLLFLILFQFLCRLNQSFNLFSGKAFFIGFEALCQFPVHTCRASLFRTDNYNGPVSIIQQIFPDQILKISGFHIFLQKFKNRDGLHVDKGLFFVIQPAVKQLKPVHQSPGIVAEIRLAEPEFMIVNSGSQSFPVHTLICDFLQGILNYTDKFILLLQLSILGYNRKNRLINSIVVGSQNILSDPRVQKGLFQRRAGSGQKGIIQNLERQIQLFIQGSADDLIVGKIGILLLTLPAGNGILLHHFPHLVERLLETDGRIHRIIVKIRQVILIQPSQFLLHIHISVKINITVGGMIVFSVEIQKLPVSKLRNHLRISAGLICIRSVREKRIQNHPVQNTFR